MCRQNWGVYYHIKYKRDITIGVLDFLDETVHRVGGVVPAPDETIYLVDINGTRYWGSI